MTRRRRSVAPCGASVLLAVAAAHAAPTPRTPCEVAFLPDPIKQLEERLKTRDAAAWATIARDAAALATSGPQPARACAHYSAGAAWFFLSERRTDRRRNAAAAARHLVTAELLAPRAMVDRQPQSRLATAWERVGVVDGWLPRPAPPVAVELPARTGTVVLSPGSTQGWAAICGPTCAGSMRIELPLDPDTSQTVHLRPGRWRVELATACGATAHVVDVDGGVLRVPGDSPCEVTLAPHDGDRAVERYVAEDAGGRRLERIDATHNPITVRAAGYLPEVVQVSPTGGRLPVPLRRCPVALTVHATPADARITGAGAHPWGEAQVVLRRAGYADLEARVPIPAPTDCAGAQHTVSLTLARQVAVVPIDSDGEPVVLARLWIDDAVVDVAGLALRPGSHRYQAEHPALGTVTGAFAVDACGAGDCSAAILRLRFERRLRPSRTGPYLLVGSGVAAGLVGLGFGIAALSTQADIDGYSSRREEGRSIDALLSQRDDYARIADTTLLAGGALVLGGIIWLATGGD